MILTEDIDSRSTPRWLRWSYIPYNAAPDRLLHRFNRLRPKLLYGWVTPLRRLALYARESATDLHQPRSVITTAEALDPATGQLLREVFGAEPYEFYGLTETGTTAWECASHDGYHLSEDTLIAEFPDFAHGSPVSRLILTNLELKAMPFIRYETGDIVTLKSDVSCQCGRPSRRIAQVEGRNVDCVRLGDGRLVLPYEFTFVLKQIKGINRYQVVQEDLAVFNVRYEGPHAGEAKRAEEIRMVIAGLVDADAQVHVSRTDNLDPPAGQKFRIVESRLALPE
jgi:phenylacetate-CoA ligase